jgi:hypothetical protein
VKVRAFWCMNFSLNIQLNSSGFIGKTFKY